MTRYFVLGGAVHVMVGDTLPAGAVEVDRLPEQYEALGPNGWEMDCRLRADTEAGALHISEARALKYLEAITILSGVPLTIGMLAMEAAQKGISIEELAADVLSRRARFVAVEVQRQIRQDGGEEDVEAIEGAVPISTPQDQG